MCHRGNVWSDRDGAALGEEQGMAERGLSLEARIWRLEDIKHLKVLDYFYADRKDSTRWVRGVHRGLAGRRQPRFFAELNRISA